MDDLTADLLVEAGIGVGEVVSVEPMEATGYMNRHELISLRDGSRLVARHYGWPWGGDGEPIDRMAKELALLRHFEAHAAPTPRALAGVRHDATTAALLMVFEPGVLLAECAGDVESWRAAGAALRAVHDLPLPAPLVSAEGIGLVTEHLTTRADEPATWGEWHVDNTRRHATEARISDEQRRRAIDLAEVARPLLDAAPRRLIHTDANAWNVLIGPDRRAVWLDWEFAWFADPSYDFVRMVNARKTDIGPTPQAFFDGYGVAGPPQPLHDFYTLGFMLWMHNERVHVDRTMHSYDVADAYVADLDRHVEDVERALHQISTS